MHDTRVKMKDGRTFCAPIWTYRPEDGYITLVGEGDKLYFRDMESCVTESDRISVKEVNVDVDVLAEARKHGWDGK